MTVITISSSSLARSNSRFFCNFSSPSPNKHRLSISVPFSKLKPRRRKNALRDKLKLISLPTQHQVIKKLIEFEDDTEFKVEIDSEKENLSEPVIDYCDFDGKANVFPISVNNLQQAKNVPFMIKALTVSGFIICTFWVFRGVMNFFVKDRKEKVELNREEAEMLRRKKKARMEKKGYLDKGTVEFIENVNVEFGTRPQLDRNELLKCIKDVEQSKNSLDVSKSINNLKLNPQCDKESDFDSKVKEIREMARKARELEQKGHVHNDESTVKNSKDIFGSKVEPSAAESSNANVTKNEEVKCIEIATADLPDKERLNNNTSEMAGEVQEMNQNEYIQNNGRDVSDVNEIFGSLNEVGILVESDVYPKHNDELIKTASNNSIENESSRNTKESVRKTPKIIKSVKEAKEYLLEKHGKDTYRQSKQVTDENEPHTKNLSLKAEFNGENNGEYSRPKLSTSFPVNGHFEKTEDKPFYGGFNMEERDFESEKTPNSNSEVHNNVSKISGNIDRESWVEENFEKFDPLIKTIGEGFRENYMSAQEKVKDSMVSAEISELGLADNDEELEWMKDEKLREIVLQVRDNEVSGRDPFHLMDTADQQAFFKGLELKAAKVNEKLSGLHEWVHSRIENLDYGREGISLDDPLEKMVPRWKGAAIDQELQSLKKNTEQNPLTKPLNVSNRSLNGASTSNNTFIECSDGTRRPGKKMGKEHWEHTKKWSQGFLEVYNSETDPEIKSIMKDMGKDLDKWITEKETKEVANLMTRIPKRQRRYIQKKMDKLKKELDMFGPQAVVSKYKEYSDEQEEDYFWWLDLQYVLCIELYTVEDGVQKIGFYSLEMAAELELEPKQYHVIAFEDPADSKNFCYIVQAHMEMLGSGSAFVVARPPKDAFREAKANGFNVTVIKKGEMKLNIDQTVEEVEEKITEIGSKIYHDKIMSERGIDIRTLMKGLISADKAKK